MEERRLGGTRHLREHHGTAQSGAASACRCLRTTAATSRLRDVMVLSAFVRRARRGTSAAGASGARGVGTTACCAWAGQNPVRHAAFVSFVAQVGKAHVGSQQRSHMPLLPGTARRTPEGAGLRQPALFGPWHGAPPTEQRWHSASRTSVPTRKTHPEGRLLHGLLFAGMSRIFRRRKCLPLLRRSPESCMGQEGV